MAISCRFAKARFTYEIRDFPAFCRHRRNSHRAVADSRPLQAAEREETIPGRSEITTRTLIVTPDAAPPNQAMRAAAILFVGGNGDLSAMKGNFLLRIRQSLSKAGILLAFPDAPSDRSGAAISTAPSAPASSMPATPKASCSS